VKSSKRGGKRCARSAPSRRRLAARVFVIVFCGPFVVAVIVAAVTFVRGVAG
jgi:hypothetical protein